MSKLNSYFRQQPIQLSAMNKEFVMDGYKSVTTTDEDPKTMSAVSKSNWVAAGKDSPAKYRLMGIMWFWKERLGN